MVKRYKHSASLSGSQRSDPGSYDKDQTYCVVLHVVEGINFYAREIREGESNSAVRTREQIIMNAALNTVDFEIEGAPSATAETVIFNSNCIWECDMPGIKRIKTDNRPVKVTFFVCSPAMERKTVGTLLLPIRGLPIVSAANFNAGPQLKMFWHKLICISNEFRSHKPEVLLMLCVIKKSLLNTKEFEHLMQFKNRKSPTSDAVAGAELRSPGHSITANMLQSQANVYVQSLVQLGLLQVGNDPLIDCDIIEVVLQMKELKNLNALVRSLSQNKPKEDTVLLVFDFVGNVTNIQLKLNDADAYCLNDVLGLRFKSSLRSIRLYFQRIFYLPINMYINGTVVANYRMDFGKLLPEDSYFNDSSSYVRNGLFVFDRLERIGSARDLKPILEYTFSVEIKAIYSRQVAIDMAAQQQQQQPCAEPAKQLEDSIDREHTRNENCTENVEAMPMPAKLESASVASLNVGAELSTSEVSNSDDEPVAYLELKTQPPTGKKLNRLIGKAVTPLPETCNASDSGSNELLKPSRVVSEALSVTTEAKDVRIRQHTSTDAEFTNQVFDCDFESDAEILAMYQRKKAGKSQLNHGAASKTCSPPNALHGDNLQTVSIHSSKFKQEEMQTQQSKETIDRQQAELAQIEFTNMHKSTVSKKSSKLIAEHSGSNEMHNKLLSIQLPIQKTLETLLTKVESLEADNNNVMEYISAQQAEKAREAYKQNAEVQSKQGEQQLSPKSTPKVCKLLKLAAAIAEEQDVELQQSRKKQKERKTLYGNAKEQPQLDQSLKCMKKTIVEKKVADRQPEQDQSFATSKDQSFATPKDQSFASPKDQSFATPKDQSFATPIDQSFASPKDQSFATPKDQSFATPKKKLRPIVNLAHTISHSQDSDQELAQYELENEIMDFNCAVNDEGFDESNSNLDCFWQELSAHSKKAEARKARRVKETNIITQSPVETDNATLLLEKEATQMKNIQKTSKLLLSEDSETSHEDHLTLSRANPNKRPKAKSVPALNARWVQVNEDQVKALLKIKQFIAETCTTVPDSDTETFAEPKKGIEMQINAEQYRRLSKANGVRQDCGDVQFQRPSNAMGESSEESELAELKCKRNIKKNKVHVIPAVVVTNDDSATEMVCEETKIERRPKKTSGKFDKLPMADESQKQEEEPKLKRSSKKLINVENSKQRVKKKIVHQILDCEEQDLEQEEILCEEPKSKPRQKSKKLMQKALGNFRQRTVGDGVDEVADNSDVMTTKLEKYEYNKQIPLNTILSKQEQLVLNYTIKDKTTRQCIASTEQDEEPKQRKPKNQPIRKLIRQMNTSCDFSNDNYFVSTEAHSLRKKSLKTCLNKTAHEDVSSNECIELAREKKRKSKLAHAVESDQRQEQGADNEHWVKGMSRKSSDQSSKSAADSVMLDETLVAELEQWQQHQMELFQSELLRKEQLYKRNLEEQESEARQLDCDKLGANIRQMAELKQTLLDVHNTLHKQVQNTNKEHTNLHIDYENKFTELEQHIIKLKAEMEQQLLLFENRNREMRQENKQLSLEKTQLRQRIAGMEEQLAQLRSQALTGNQLQRVLSEMHIQNERFLDLSKAKDHYKKQWRRCTKRVHALKLAMYEKNVQQERKTMEKNFLNLKNILTKDAAEFEREFGRFRKPAAALNFPLYSNSSADALEQQLQYDFSPSTKKTKSKHRKTKLEVQEALP